MAKEKLDPEEKKKRRKKQIKYLAIFCVSGFVLLFLTMVIKDYKDSQAEKLRLSSDRNKYYVKAFEEKDPGAISDEFFGEMFLSSGDWFELDADRSVELEDMAKEYDGDLDIGVTTFCGIGSAELDIGCNFTEDPGEYAKYISGLADKLWCEGGNQDVSFRLYGDDGTQVLAYCDNGEMFLDYFFIDSDLESKWEALRTTAELSKFKKTEYKDIVLNEEVVREQMEKYDTVMPYVTDELIKAYNDRKKVRIIFKSDKAIGYEYMSEGMENSLIDETYSEELNPEEVAENAGVTEGVEKDSDSKVGISNDFIDEGGSESTVDEKSSTELTSYEDLDFNTKEDVYLSPDDYCTYADYVEENDLDYNGHIKIGEEAVSDEGNEEEYTGSKSWVCVFGNQKLMDDISWIINKLDSSNISYQLMYYLYQCSSASYDLSWGMETLIKNFVK